MALALEHDRPLAPLTTLGLGGRARYFVEATERDTLLEALRWARRENARVELLGGGSNLVVADEGFAGLVVRMATRGLELDVRGEHALLTVQAGEPWQAVVERALAEDLAGLECLTGIPGSAGATPIQNVGAYGQEVSETLVEVEVLDRESLHTSWLAAEACGFGYRTSRFKHDPARYVVLAARFRLRVHGAPKVRYTELERALASVPAPSLRQVADVVWSLRAKKSMVLDPSDANSQSAGSFFTNPIVTHAEAHEVQRIALALGLVSRAEELPTYPQDNGRVKLAAGFLIERAGIKKGLRKGPVGVSSNHALALVHHGGGTTTELLALADEIRAKVRATFGITLEQEPVLWR